VTDYDPFPAIRFTYQGDTARAMQCVPQARALMQQLTRRMEAMGREVGVWNVTTPDGIQMCLQRFGDQVAAAIYAPEALPAPVPLDIAPVTADATPELDEAPKSARYQRDFREELVPVEGGDLWIGARSLLLKSTNTVINQREQGLQRGWWLYGADWHEELFPDYNEAPFKSSLYEYDIEYIPPIIGLVLFPPGWKGNDRSLPHDSRDAKGGRNLFTIDSGEYTTRKSIIRWIAYANSYTHAAIMDEWRAEVNEIITIQSQYGYNSTEYQYPYSGHFNYEGSTDIMVFLGKDIYNNQGYSGASITYSVSEFGAFTTWPFIYNRREQIPVHTFIAAYNNEYPQTQADLYHPSDDINKHSLYTSTYNDLHTESVQITTERSLSGQLINPTPLTPFPDDVGAYTVYEKLYGKTYGPSVLDGNVTDSDFSEFDNKQSAPAGIYELRMATGFDRSDEDLFQDADVSAEIEITIQLGNTTSTYVVTSPLVKSPPSYFSGWRDFYETPFDEPGWYPGYWLIDTETGSIIHETEDLTRPWFNA